MPSLGNGSEEAAAALGLAVVERVDLDCALGRMDNRLDVHISRDLERVPSGQERGVLRGNLGDTVANNV